MDKQNHVMIYELECSRRKCKTSMSHRKVDSITVKDINVALLTSPSPTRKDCDDQR